MNVLKEEMAEERSIGRVEVQYAVSQHVCAIILGAKDCQINFL